MLVQLRAAVVAFALLTLLLGGVYPALVTAIAQGVFRAQAEGSLTSSNGVVTGSTLLGQPFASPKYFWGRLSATSPFPYNAGSSAADNLGPTNPALTLAAKARLLALAAADPTNNRPVPVDLVTASASGLDPEITPAAAYYQVGRVARARGMDEGRARKLVEAAVETPTFGLLGEPRVNVVRLNRTFDAER